MILINVFNVVQPAKPPMAALLGHSIQTLQRSWRGSTYVLRTLSLHLPKYIRYLMVKVRLCKQRRPVTCISHKAYVICAPVSCCPSGNLVAALERGRSSFANILKDRVKLYPAFYPSKLSVKQTRSLFGATVLCSTLEMAKG